VRTWWSSLLRSRDRGSTFRLIAFNAVGIVLFLLWGSNPVATAADELRVIAVHTASAPRVSMVVEPPVTPSQNGSATESFSVSIDGRPVATTVSPMASGDLSVALVIDTASRITSQELAAVQSGAAEFLLRLPDGAHTMVVAAAGEPQVVAPLSARRAEALSAVSALRGGGSRATMAATMLAAQSLESAPPGPRAIIVYTHGPDRQALPIRLSQAVRHSEAVLNVIRTGTDVLWPSVVDQTGGGVVTTTAENIVQTFGDVAAMLGEQYLVMFEAPDELPAVAQVGFQTDDQEYSTVVSLPTAGAAQAEPQAAPAPRAIPLTTPTESSGGSPHRGGPWLIPSLVAGLVLMTVLGVFVRRARQLRHAYAGEPSTEMAGPATGAPPPNKAASTSAPRPRTTADGNALPLPKQSDLSPPAADKAAPSAPPSKQPAVPTASLADDPAQNDPPQSQPHTPPAESKPARSSLSGAIAGRRLARLILDSQPESRPEPAEQRNEADNHQTEDPLAHRQARNPAEGRSTASGKEAGTKADSGRPESPAEDDPSSSGWLRSFHTATPPQ
jgi:hypothetical protein